MTTHYNQAMDDWLDIDLLELARLYLQNEDLFVARRCVHWFKAGEISAADAVQRIRRCPTVIDEPF